MFRIQYSHQQAKVEVVLWPDDGCIAVEKFCLEVKSFV